MRHWPLVAFTLLAQTAAGAYCILAAAQFAAPGAVYLDRAALLFVLVPAVLAMAVSFLHLGSPLKAYRAALGFRSSWLSREILAMSSFCACLAAQAGYALLRNAADISPVFLAVTGCLALAVVYCISRVYMLRTVPAWDSWLTFLSFLCAAVILGGGAALAWLSAQGMPVPAAGRAGTLVRVEIPLAMGACAALEAWLVVRGARAGRRPLRYGEIRPRPAAVPWVRYLAGILLALGVALLAAAPWLPASPEAPARIAWLAPALIVLFGAEVLNRISFYAAGLGERA